MCNSIKDVKEQCDYLESELQGEINQLKNYVEELEHELKNTLRQCNTVDDYKTVIEKVLGKKKEVILKNDNGDLFSLSVEDCEFNESEEK